MFFGRQECVCVCVCVFVRAREGTEVAAVAVSTGHSETQPACWEGQAVPLSPGPFSERD